MYLPHAVSFEYVPEPDSFGYELRIRFGGRCEITGGFAPDGGPDARMLQAALWLLTGGEEAHVRLDPQQPWGVRMTFRTVQVGMAPNGLARWGCEISLTDLDDRNEPEAEPRVIVATPSLTQLARAVLEFAEPRAGTPPYNALITMRAALPLIEAAEAERERGPSIFSPPG
jgi:hypothetical protein